MPYKMTKNPNGTYTVSSVEHGWKPTKGKKKKAKK